MNTQKVAWKIDKYKADPQKVYEEIGDQNTTPEEVLEKAKDPASELHKCFEWDDTKAAEKYRLRQATLLITNLAVEVEIPEAKPIICRAYVNVSDTKKGTFMKVDSAFKVEETREIVIERALRELRAFEEK